MNVDMRLIFSYVYKNGKKMLSKLLKKMWDEMYNSDFIIELKIYVVI